jgi:hypothetical protein
MRAPLVLVHPRERTLHRYADGMLTRLEQAPVAAHLADCPRCRAQVAFARDLGAAARRLAAPEPDDALLDRVLADRAAGARTILPAATPAAAIAAITVGARTVARVLRAPIGGPAWTARVDTRTLFRDVPGFFTGTAARALEPAAAPFPPPAVLAPERMRPVRATYEVHEPTPEGTLRPAGRSALDVAPTVVDGEAAWRVVRALRLEATPARRWRLESETVYVARADLRLLGRTEHVSPYRSYAYVTVRQRVSADSVVGWMNVDEGLGRAIRREIPRGARPYTTDALAPVLLMAAPLHARWAGSVSMLRWAVADDDLLTRVSLRVTGEETITVPAGTFDCWRLTVVADGRPLVHWARKSDGLAVKVSVPGREIVLASAGR